MMKKQNNDKLITTIERLRERGGVHANVVNRAGTTLVKKY